MQRQHDEDRLLLDPSLDESLHHLVPVVRQVERKRLVHKLEPCGLEKGPGRRRPGECVEGFDSFPSQDIMGDQQVVCVIRPDPGPRPLTREDRS